MKMRKLVLGGLVVCLFAVLSGAVFAADPVVDQDRVAAGKELFTSKSCVICHAVNAVGGKVGPDLGEWESFASTSLWAAIMWNHVPNMIKEFKAKKIEFPSFKPGDIELIFEYIHAQAKNKGGTYAFPGDADRGAFLFQYLGCKQCHAIENKGGSVGPALDGMGSRFKTDGELAGHLIAHAPYMAEDAERQKLYWPRLQGNEIAHLFEYFKSLK